MRVWEPTPDSPYARTLMIPQWRVEETLRELLCDLGARVEWGTPVTGLAQDDDGVTVTLAGGATARARYVIGCDGGSSTVRRLLGVRFLGDTHEDVRMLLGDVRLDGLDRDHWHAWTTPERPFLALCPLPATDAFQFQSALLPGETAEPSLAAFQAIVDEVVSGVRLREATWLSHWRLNVRMVERFRVGRVLLAGDAAHVHSPAGAQGMNTGVQDAANLGWKLAAVIAGAGPELLDTYEAERLPVAAVVLGLSSRLSSPALERRRADREQTLQLGVTYRGGPLSPDVPGEGPRPGDRAPDAPCRRPDGRRVRLFDLQRGGHWTLYGFGVRPPEPAGDVHAVEIGADVIDDDGHACNAYAATGGDLVLVRPDGYVGLRTADAGEITRYLAQFRAGVRSQLAPAG